MTPSKRPYVWQMVREAVEVLGSPTTNVAVREWILNRYPGTNKSTIQCQIAVCTVNQPSRIHYPENKKPRKCDTQYDFLYRPSRGILERYDSSRHGVWEIYETEAGELALRLIGDEAENYELTDCVGSIVANSGSAFAAESHLRDYLAQHLSDLEDGLDLYVDDDGNDGIEFTTPIGRIDILATDKSGGFVVIELKVGRGPHAVCGQIMLYMSWVKRHLAKGRPVRGIIVAQRISDRIRYATADMPHVQLKEYELSLKIQDAAPLEA